MPNVETRLLTGFQADQSWELEPGDMLYLPPRVPHQGVSLSEDCITVSMGFRAPSQRSMLIAFADHVCQTAVAEGEMYSDQALPLQASIGMNSNFYLLFITLTRALSSAS